jgi:hypothetical protein
MPSGENVSTGHCVTELVTQVADGNVCHLQILIFALDVSKILGLLRVGGRCEEEHR